MGKKIKRKKSTFTLKDAQRILENLKLRKRRLEALLIRKKAQASAFLERIPSHVNADHFLKLERELADGQRALDEMERDLADLQQMEDSLK